MPGRRRDSQSPLQRVQVILRSENPRGLREALDALANEIGRDFEDLESELFAQAETTGLSDDNVKGWLDSVKRDGGSPGHTDLDDDLANYGYQLDFELVEMIDRIKEKMCTFARGRESVRRHPIASSRPRW